MGRHQHGLTRRQLWYDLGGPVGFHPLQRRLQALGVRQNDPGIAAIAGEVPLAAGGQGRRRGVVGPPPDPHLLGTVPLGGLGLVQASQAAIVPLVQAPVLGLGHEGLARRRQGQPKGADGAGQDGGVGPVDLQSRRLDQLATLAGLGLALGGQVHIHPSGEPVLQVPLALAVSKQDQGRHGRSPSRVRVGLGPASGAVKAGLASLVAPGRSRRYVGAMSDRVFYSGLALVAAALIVLALVWPQGLGARSPGPFGSVPVQQRPEVQAAMRREAEVNNARLQKARDAVAAARAATEGTKQAPAEPKP